MRSRNAVENALGAAAMAAALLTAPPAFPLGLERAGDIAPAGGGAGVLAPAALWYDGVRDVIAVACPNLHRVVLLDRQGAVQKELGEGGELRFPRSVAATRDGTLYVASPGEESLAVFERYAAAMGGEARTLSLGAHRRSAAVRPSAVFADADGRLYVADRGNRQILVLGSDGAIERTLPNVGEPVDLWADRSGTVYVAEPGFGGVRVYGASGKLLRTLGTSPSQFREPIRPRAIAVDRAGRVWILEEGNRGIKALDALGNLLFARSAEGLFGPADLAIDPRDHLYVLEEGGNRIAVFRITGT